jgi:hypothetical protein
MTNTGPKDIFRPEIESYTRRRSGAGGGSLSKPYDNKAVSLDYIRQLLLELRAIADSQGEGTLVYLLEMSALEAEACLKAHKFNSELIK